MIKEKKRSVKKMHKNARTNLAFAPLHFEILSDKGLIISEKSHPKIMGRAAGSA